MKKILMACAALLAINAFAGATDEQKADTYPLTTCVVSGEKLGEMGDPFIFQHEGREVRFCCKDCKKDFLKEPATYLKMIDDAAAAKKALESKQE
jgi:YHS domain-containing protein